MADVNGLYRERNQAEETEEKMKDAKFLSYDANFLHKMKLHLNVFRIKNKFEIFQKTNF